MQASIYNCGIPVLVHHDTWPLLLEMILADLLATEWVADMSYENKKYNS